MAVTSDYVQEGEKLNDNMLCISYWDKELNQSCLVGLSKEEKDIFQAIVLKQYENGIKIKISYKEEVNN